jgi:hypothetical protein
MDLRRSAGVGDARYCADGVEGGVEVVRRSAEAVVAHGLDMGGLAAAAISDEVVPSVVGFGWGLVMDHMVRR